jgi:hypothetical protein
VVVSITERPLPAPDTNAKPGTVTTSNGFPPVWTRRLPTCFSCVPLAVWVVHPGGVSTSAWADPVVLAPAEKEFRTKYPTAARTTTTASATTAQSPRRRRGGSGRPGAARRLKAGGRPGGPGV